MSSIERVLFVVVLCASCVHSAFAAAHHARTKAPNASAELVNLIHTFMIPSTDNETVLPWTTGSEPGTEIAWLHAGVTDCDPDIFKRFGGVFCRRGRIIVTVNSHPMPMVLGVTVP